MLRWQLQWSMSYTNRTPKFKSQTKHCTCRPLPLTLNSYPKPNLEPKCNPWSCPYIFGKIKPGANCREACVGEESIGNLDGWSNCNAPFLCDLITILNAKKVKSQDCNIISFVWSTHSVIDWKFHTQEPPSLNIFLFCLSLSFESIIDKLFIAQRHNLGIILSQ